MDCNQAQRLINQGLTPGSQPPARAQLGFHLAQCPTCRAYWQQAPRPVHHAPQDRKGQQQRNRPAAPPRAPRSVLPTRRQITNLLGSILVVGLLFMLLWVGSIAIRTQRNLDAMIVTPVPTSAEQRAGAEGDASASGSSPLHDSAAAAAPATPEADQAEQTPPGLVIERDTSPTATTDAASIEPSPTMGRPRLAVTAPPPGEPVTVLLLGNDRRPGEQDPPRTDVIMLIRVDPQNQRIALLSLLRDLWIEIPGYAPNRINEAYRLGEIYGEYDGGLGLARRTVSNLLDIPIDYVVMVDFQGFMGLIDTLGGITVNVEKELYDARYPTMDYGYQVAHFLPGPEMMDGERALMYSRIRHPDSDFMRIRRQQAVITAIGARIRERGDLENVLSADQITGALVGYVQTDMPRQRILGLVWAMRDYDLAAVERYPMTVDMVSMGVGSDRYALVPYPGALPQLTRSFLGTP